MINFGSMLPFITMYAVNSYYEDKERMRREKAAQYKECFEKLGDNVAELGSLILETVKKSGRIDLEQQIIQGAQRLPLYLLLEIVKVQGRPITENQLKIVEISFNTFAFLGFTKAEYITALKNNDSTRELLSTSVGLTPEHCGAFWEEFIGLIYTTRMSERDFEKLICCYSEIVFRLALLGDCDVKRAERVDNNFRGGLSAYMKKYAEGQIGGDEVNLENPYNAMKNNCYNLDQAVNEDGILMDMFDYFIAALIIGYIERTNIASDLKPHILEHFITKLGLEVQISATEIYENYQYNPGMKQVFYDSANSWDDANYWKIQLISAIRAGREQDAVTFMEDTITFMQLVEADIIAKFSIPEISGTAARYMEIAVGQMGALTR